MYYKVSDEFQSQIDQSLRVKFSLNVLLAYTVLFEQTGLNSVASIKLKEQFDQVWPCLQFYHKILDTSSSQMVLFKC